MSRSDGEKIKHSALLLTFDGKYGGDIYEDWLFKELSARISIKKASEKRRGGLRTLGSLGKLILKGLCFGRGSVVRPFGMPVFKKNMVVVFHHYDHGGLPWYGRLVECVDMLGLKLTHRFLNIQFLVVSRYWQQWLEERGFMVKYRVYNQIEGMVNAPSLEDRSYLAKKYGLKYESKWVFLGGNQLKKGGQEVIQLWRQQSIGKGDYQFIFSGKPIASELAVDEAIVWIDDKDYASFVSQLHVAVANSKFDEGWCRVAHEAILSDVPVVGSGRGGMGELLSMASYESKYTQQEMIEFIKMPKIPLPDTGRRVATLIADNNEIELARLAVRLSGLER